jgi:V8-like Glu-specific endopeptidase
LKENITIVAFDLQTWPEGTAIAFTGFPLESKSPVTSKGDIAGFGAITETIAAFDYSIDRAAWPGASGSPLYLSNGRVIGIVRAAGENLGSGISYARSAAVISNFLSKHPYAAK